MADRNKDTAQKIIYEDKSSHFLAYLLVFIIIAILFGGAYWGWVNYIQPNLRSPQQGITINVPSTPINIELPDQEIVIEVDIPEPTKSAESVVEDFYDWYINYAGDPLKDEAYMTHAAITDILAEKIEKLSVNGGNDPFFCSQNKPSGFTVSPASSVGSNAATVVVNENFNGSTTQVKINLRLSGTAWQMTNIQCVKKSNNTAFLDLLRNETGIPFSSLRPMTFKWNIPDDKGSEVIIIQGQGFSANGIKLHPDALQRFFKIQGFDMDPLSLDTGKDGYQKDNMVCLVEDAFDKSGEHDVTVSCGEL